MSYDCLKTNDLKVFIESNKLINLINKLNIPNDYLFSHEKAILKNISASYPGLDKAVSSVKGKRKIGDYLYELLERKSKKLEDINLRAGISKEYWHKVTNGKIHPSKKKLLSLAIILKLDLEETEKLLRVAGYSLARDLTTYEAIMGYCIENQIYSFMEIDEILHEYGEETIYSIN